MPFMAKPPTRSARKATDRDRAVPRAGRIFRRGEQSQPVTPSRGIMCSRICLSTDLGEISSRFGLCDNKLRLKPHWNIGAGNHLPVLRLDALLQWRRMELMRWGLIPALAKSPMIVRAH